jgi:hypothetical protein
MQLRGSSTHLCLKLGFAFGGTRWRNVESLEQSVENVKIPFGFVRFYLRDVSGGSGGDWMSRVIADLSHIVKLFGQIISHQVPADDFFYLGIKGPTSNAQLLPYDFLKASAAEGSTGLRAQVQHQRSFPVFIPQIVRDARRHRSIGRSEWMY